MNDHIEILENRKELLGDLIRLNEEWISTFFEIEDRDRALARSPEKILDDGGHTFSLRVGGYVVGVCALFQNGNGVYELARMAVTPTHQGKGYGNLLIEAALRKLREIGATKVFLLSNTKLESAIRLYQKYDFKTTFEGPHPVYARANIVMELML